MSMQNKYKILIWVVIILVATNLSMGISFLYHKQQDEKALERVEEEAIEVPAERRTRFFRQELGLHPGQMERFRELNRQFNRKAWQVTHDLELLRIEMVAELGTEEPDLQKLDDLSRKIGELHVQMKRETIDYYLAMRDECTPEQRERLNGIFMSVLRKNEDVRLPHRGGRRGPPWQNE